MDVVVVVGAGTESSRGGTEILLVETTGAGMSVAVCGVSAGMTMISELELACSKVVPDSVDSLEVALGVEVASSAAVELTSEDTSEELPAVLCGMFQSKVRKTLYGGASRAVT